MFDTINGWVAIMTEILSGLVVLAIITGVLFNDPFGIINTIGNLIGSIGEQGLAGLICLTIILIYKK